VFSEFGWFQRDMVSQYDRMGTTELNVMLVAGVLTLLMVATTFLTSRQMVLKTGWATEPTQLMMQRLMVYGLPFMLLFSGAFFPISVIIYWVVNNLFSLGQQQWVLRKYPPPKTASAAKAVAGIAGSKPGGRQPAGKGKKDADGAGDRPGVDGKKLAPKVGAKPVKNVPPKRVPSKSIPPKRKGAASASRDPAPGAGGNRNTGKQDATPRDAVPTDAVPTDAAAGGTPPATRKSSDRTAGGRSGSGRSRRRTG
jgi:hypothetical protein